jgi:Holliday junction resolvasome RuvABC endonuclease subunit
VKPWAGGRILSLDPSSTACGWAILEGWPATLHSFGVERPRGRKCPVDRMRRITSEIRALVDQCQPDKIVIEWADGKQHGRIKGRSQGLSTLGQAQGWLAATLETMDYEPQYVPVGQWAGGTKKERRAAAVAREFPDYAAWSAKGRDRGHDAADAIGLGLWWLQKRWLIDLNRGQAA